LIAKQDDADSFNLLKKCNKTLNNIELKELRIMDDSESPTDENESSIFKPDLTDLFPDLPADEAINKMGQFIDVTKTNIDKNTALDPQSPNNVYYIFIEQARRAALFLKNINPNIYLEKHHILPLHAGGTDEPSNLVRLTFSDHLIAHYIRWIVYREPGDRIAYQMMLGQPDEETRRLRASLGGHRGGRVTQARFRASNRGRFNSEAQRNRGRAGAEVNRQQGTGAWDPNNLVRANQRLRELEGIMQPIRLDNLARGRETQRQRRINIHDRFAQRRRSLKYHGVVINNVRYLADPDAPIYHGVTVDDVFYPVSPQAPRHICDTTLEYYIKFAP
jgi:hypothetical protein